MSMNRPRLFTRRLGDKGSYTRQLITDAYLPAAGKISTYSPGWIVGNSSGSRANNIYSPDSNKLTGVQLYMSTVARQPGNPSLL